MKFLLTYFTVFASLASAWGQQALFNGKDFSGWNGDIPEVWTIQNGLITGGSLEKTVDKNYFLATEKIYSDFVLKLKIRLRGEEGFINSGIQFRSVRSKDPANEMIGYQADFGKEYWGTLYDESRRNKTLAGNDPKTTEEIVKLSGWNDYELRAEGKRIRIFINGQLCTDYTETDDSIPQTGHIAIQVHGGGKALVEVKDIYIEEL
ncbi:DUF1080 domain-containing protein [Marinilongibacter aquaticus]|uniref:3-keto-disaccharide hydrolase n=1 Tax=Marinilongibacter aquaticus TaxID=2975157 RepID=UPI0021BD0CA7|nr:DUF1080 domain-containing protein [Marinilongibacter aquaticus]UBM58298.1 DUF1080 domain-containing protein [Marinilongibacter aquaticus]